MPGAYACWLQARPAPSTVRARVYQDQSSRARRLVDRPPKAIAVEVGDPLGVATPGSENPPRDPARRSRRTAQPPAELGHRAVGLDVVATSAARDDVVPRVRSAAAARYDVIKAGCRRFAVGATPTVAQEHPAPGQRDDVAIRNLHEPGELDDGRYGDRRGRTVHDHVAGLERDGLRGEDQQQGTAVWHDADGFVR